MRGSLRSDGVPRSARWRATIKSITERDLLAAIGEVVVNAALFEYAVAILVATMEGCRAQECEHRAVGIVRPARLTMREFHRLVGEHPDRKDIQLALYDARSVLDDWHVIAHSLAMEDTEAGG